MLHLPAEVDAKLLQPSTVIVQGAGCGSRNVDPSVHALDPAAIAASAVLSSLLRPSRNGE